MPTPLRHQPRAVLGFLVFLAATAVMIAVGFGAARLIEERTKDTLHAAFTAHGIDWITLEADGMQVHVNGTAPTEAARFRALNLIATLIDSSRLRDNLEVTPTTAVAAPRFSVEMLRNDDGIQLIGLVPRTPASGGLTREDLVAAVNDITADDVAPINMLQTAEWPAPEHWDTALRFGVEALSGLKRSKISISADMVRVTALAASAAEKRRIEAELARKKPANVALDAVISAPRPVIAPFTLRFLLDAEGARFDACSADTERARARIQAAGRAAGVTPDPRFLCPVGLGSPSPRWADAVSAAIVAVKAMGEGSVTFSDADVTFTAGPNVTEQAFDQALGELRAKLPDAFSLVPVPPAPKAAEIRGPREFLVERQQTGAVVLRGRLVDEAQQAAVDAYARAAFGAKNVHVATRLDPDLPQGWPVRVLAGLEALSHLAHGTLSVRPDAVTITGESGSQEARGRITQILSGSLGQGASFDVQVRYNEELDPSAALPTPEECIAEVREISSTEKINFAPSAAEITGASNQILARIAEVLRDCPPLELEIGGYTDSQGTESGNQRLSQSRADAVLSALTGRRVDTSLMTAVGYGELNPIADNSTEEGRDANRRIEFVLTPAPATDTATVESTPSEAAPPQSDAPSGTPSDAASDAPPSTDDASTATAKAPAAQEPPLSDSVLPEETPTAPPATEAGVTEAPPAGPAPLPPQNPDIPNIRPQNRPTSE